MVEYFKNKLDKCLLSVTPVVLLCKALLPSALLHLIMLHFNPTLELGLCVLFCVYDVSFCCFLFGLNVTCTCQSEGPDLSPPTPGGRM